ncbi:hypothetical protein [Krasilnikovia sp. MM14-A1004]|uniref:hypothetical protein n=1 Tax=Krasilnikovia sp. MM14-A1004 TaxID=3373541 RepID=UPI00399C523E
MATDQPQLSPDPPAMTDQPADPGTPTGGTETGPTAEPNTGAVEPPAAPTTATSEVAASGTVGAKAVRARSWLPWRRRPSSPPPETGEASTAPPPEPTVATTPATEKPAPATPASGAPETDAPETGTQAGDNPDPGRGDLPATRPPGAPPDPWTAFATTPERGPGRLRRAVRAVRRCLFHEYALAGYACLLLAVAMTWPALRYPLHTLPQDLYDPSRQAWQVSWAGHILTADPARLWHANAFFPLPYTFAYGDSLLGYAPAGMLGTGPDAAVLRYNILFVLAHALLTFGGYALVRQLGARRTGAAVAAVAFAYAPWRLAQEGHLDIVSVGAIPLALAMLARGHGWSLRYGFRPARRRARWAVAGWLLAAWQISLGFAQGLPFAYVLALLILVVLVAVPIRRLRRRGQGPVLGWRLLVTDLVGILVVAAVGVLIALPYLRAGATGPALTEVRFFSPPVHSLLIGPAESRIWGAAHAVPRASLLWPAEMSLLPGFVLYTLALVGLLFSIWTWRQRLVMLVALASAVVLTLGTTVLDGRWTYLPLFGHLPGSFGVRIPGRLMLWVTLVLAVLAAGAVDEFVRRAEQLSAQRMPPWPSPWLRAATLIPLALVLAEGWGVTAHPVVPTQPRALRTVTQSTLVLPTSTLGDQSVMLWSTSRFQPLANGGGGFAPVHQAELRRNVATFPDAASIAYLRGLGVQTVLLVRSQVAGTPWERAGDVPVDPLGITREDLDDDTVLFRIP